MRGITLLGATGSIGMSTLDVISLHPDQYKVVALTAKDNVDRMYELCNAYKPQYVVMLNEDAAQQLTDKLSSTGLSIEVKTGLPGLIEVASLDSVDFVMCAIVGAAGLEPTLAAASKGKRILLANKEALVMSGRIFMDEIKKNNAELLPIDSEHNAIFQCMPAIYRHGSELPASIKRILLTASGGPFRTFSYDDLKSVTPEQAVAHPNWSMGRKISVDSATMMNKGLEVIEARWLFDTSPDDIDVVIHPQSVIHSMVEYVDGSILAQLGQPDMRTPIAHALCWPERMSSGVDSLDIFRIARLDWILRSLTLNVSPAYDSQLRQLIRAGRCRPYSTPLMKSL